MNQSQNQDRYRQMRIIVLYDLPTLTKENRKSFRYFHKYLLTNGYYMLQFSVYVKLCHTFDYAQESAQKLEKNSPTTGNVRYFLITEKQFRSMKMIVGKESAQEKIQNIGYLAVL
ncbi:MAG: CRISPR-associated protein Cas2 [Mycoplasmataceae bacterium RV_VA103A]|nr:MAG: CRISPR-associated protein Cas2 [Mycoplasmataceae bacterium RV_VA103A]